jgi:hypothetical protein
VLEDEIIDGRNRERACREAGVPIITRPWLGPTDESTLRRLVISKNVRRRQLTPGQAAAAAAKLATAKKGRKGKNSNAVTVEEAAELFGVSVRYVHEARAVQQVDEQLFNTVFYGLRGLKEAQAELEVRDAEKAKKAKEKRKKAEYQAQVLAEQKKAEENVREKAEQAQTDPEATKSWNAHEQTQQLQARPVAADTSADVPKQPVEAEPQPEHPTEPVIAKKVTLIGYSGLNGDDEPGAPILIETYVTAFVEEFNNLFPSIMCNEFYKHIGAVLAKLHNVAKAAKEEKFDAMAPPTQKLDVLH